MKHPLQEQGWLQMQDILDQEMPIREQKKNYLLPFFVILSLSALSLAFVMNDNRVGQIKTQKFIPTLDVNTSIAINDGQSSHGEVQNNIQSSQSVNECNQQVLSSYGKTENIELTPILVKSKNGRLNLQDPVGKQTHAEYKTVYSDKVDIENIESGSRVFEGQSEISTHQVQTQINANSLPQITSVLISEGQQNYRLPIVANIKLSDTKYLWEYNLAAGIGQNVTTKNVQHVFAQFGVNRKVNPNISLFGTVGVSIQSFDVNSISLSKGINENDPKNANQDIRNGTNIINPKTTLFADLSFGVSKNINAKMKLGLGCGFSYLIYINNNENVFSTGFSSELDYDKYNQIIDASINHFYINPLAKIDYKFSNKFSLTGQYNLGLTGIIRTPQSKRDQFYFREIRLGVSYHLGN